MCVVMASSSALPLASFLSLPHRRFFCVHIADNYGVVPLVQVAERRLCSFRWNVDVHDCDQTDRRFYLNRLAVHAVWCPCSCVDNSGSNKNCETAFRCCPVGSDGHILENIDLCPVLGTSPGCRQCRCRVLAGTAKIPVCVRPMAFHCSIRTAMLVDGLLCRCLARLINHAADVGMDIVRVIGLHLNFSNYRA